MEEIDSRNAGSSFRDALQIAISMAAAAVCSCGNLTFRWSINVFSNSEMERIFHKFACKFNDFVAEARQRYSSAFASRFASLEARRRKGEGEKSFANTCRPEGRGSFSEKPQNGNEIAKRATPSGERTQPKNEKVAKLLF